MPEQLGHKLQGTITGIKGTCGWGHKVGQKLDLSVHNTAGLCGFLYHDIFPNIQLLQFGGEWPWGEKHVIKVECPDRWNCVSMELRRLD